MHHTHTTFHGVEYVSELDCTRYTVPLNEFRGWMFFMPQAYCGIPSPYAVLAIDLASSEEAHVRVNGSADVLAVLPLNSPSNPGPKAMLQVVQKEPYYKVLGAGKYTSSLQIFEEFGRMEVGRGVREQTIYVALAGSYDCIH